DLARAASLQVIAETGGLAVAVVEEAAVAVDARIGPLAEDRFRAVHLQRFREIGAGSSLHAVVGPEHLGQTGKLHELARLLPGIRRREASVPRRMPVLRRHHEIESLLHAIRDRDHLVAARHGERAAGQEVVLQIDQDQRPHGDLRFDPLTHRSYAACFSAVALFWILRYAAFTVRSRSWLTR